MNSLIVLFANIFFGIACLLVFIFLVISFYGWVVDMYWKIKLSAYFTSSGKVEG